MKWFKRGCLIAVLFFIFTLALLEVDRQCSQMYTEGGTISGGLQVFVEKTLDLH